MIIDWGAVVLALVGGLGYVLKAVVDAIQARYKAARDLKMQRESREDSLRRLLFEWQEHAYTVRKIAIDAGVSPKNLPEKPSEEQI